MTTPYTLIEMCCGSAALTYHLLGSKRQIVPYQGSKWRYRKKLQAILEGAGFFGPPTHVHFNDIGPFAEVHSLLLDKSQLPHVINRLHLFAYEDPREVYDRLNHYPVSIYPFERSAEFLFLQRLAFSGKAVGVSCSSWNSSGFNKTSAYGKPATEAFGEVNPMIPSLIRTLNSLYDLLENEIYTSVSCSQMDAVRLFTGMFAGKPPFVVYIDPPYLGTTKYPCGNLDRRYVLYIADRWAKIGATVLLSEGEPLSNVLGDGWTDIPLCDFRDDGSPFKGKQAEWVTAFIPSDRSAA